MNWCLEFKTEKIDRLKTFALHEFSLQIRFWMKICHNLESNIISFSWYCWWDFIQKFRNCCKSRRKIAHFIAKEGNGFDKMEKGGDREIRSNDRVSVTRLNSSDVHVHRGVYSQIFRLLSFASSLSSSQCSSSSLFLLVTRAVLTNNLHEFSGKMSRSFYVTQTIVGRFSWFFLLFHFFSFFYYQCFLFLFRLHLFF